MEFIVQLRIYFNPQVLVFFISLLVSYGLRTIIISSDWLSKISIAILFLGLLIDFWKKDQ